jgi:hypothetical protein
MDPLVKGILILGLTEPEWLDTIRGTKDMDSHQGRGTLQEIFVDIRFPEPDFASSDEAIWGCMQLHERGDLPLSERVKNLLYARSDRPAQPFWAQKGFEHDPWYGGAFRALNTEEAGLISGNEIHSRIWTAAAQKDLFERKVERARFTPYTLREWAAKWDHHLAVHRSLGTEPSTTEAVLAAYPRGKYESALDAPRSLLDRGNRFIATRYFRRESPRVQELLNMSRPIVLPGPACAFDGPLGLDPRTDLF